MEISDLYCLANRYDRRIAEWGDYGEVLWTGFVDTEPDGQVYIERVGPFTPDIYLALEFLICTDRMRMDLLAAGIEGVDFLPVRKEKIVRVDWQSFPPGCEIYDALPDLDEPESLIIDAVHDHHLLGTMPSYWSIVPRSRIKIRSFPPYNRPRNTCLEAYDVGLVNEDIVAADSVLGCFVTGRGKEILERTGGQFLEFLPLRVTK